MLTFKETGIDEKIIRAVEELGFITTMPVQEKVIPILIKDDHRDIIAMAQTGTGKTAAFGLPLIQKTNPSEKFIQHLILSPTRELCLQIADDLTDFAKYTPGLKIAAVFGGSSMDKQIKKIKEGAQIISATPGRLLDLLKRKVIDLKRIRTIVLDEADEMLSMGFRDDLQAILAATPKQKNTLLFSATMSDEIKKITKGYMNNPVEISIGKRNSGSDDVNHICYMVHARDRYRALKRIVDFNPDIYGIIFCRTRVETQEVADLLVKDGYGAEALHGDLSQAQRNVVMNKFRNKNLTLLVATDVAARGLDVENLTHIINYSLPDELDLYTHRSGRTGRAGRKGTSIVISNLKENIRLELIEEQLGKEFKHLQVPGGQEICEKQLFHLIDRMEKVEVDNTQINSYLPSIYKKLEWLDREELIKKFVSLEFNRFLDYYKNSPDLNKTAVNDKVRRKDAESTRFFINLGKTDNLEPESLTGLINEFTGVNNIEIEEMEILKNFSFFETDKKYTGRILENLTGNKFNNRVIGVEIATKKENGKKSAARDRKDNRNSSKDNKRRKRSRNYR
ncbi:MAG TPA: DEAD/DEAH box helicase [Ignavibacteriaceae bacterium]|nr:DEAD/DEAH box helicase [Ignavibacteriaceae bacterium]